MSLNLENQGNLIAKVMKNGKDANMKLYVTDKENTVRNGGNSFECKPDESLQIVPNNKQKDNVHMYVLKVEVVRVILLLIM